MEKKAELLFSLNSLKGIIYGTIWRTILGLIKGDTRRLDCGSCVA